MIMKNNKFKIHKRAVKYFAPFMKMTADIFSFLVTDYGFEHVSTVIYLPECVLKYQNETTGVNIVYELQSMVWVNLVRLNRISSEVSEGLSYSLDALIMERCPDRHTTEYFS